MEKWCSFFDLTPLGTFDLELHRWHHLNNFSRFQESVTPTKNVPGMIILEGKSVPRAAADFTQQLKITQSCMVLQLTSATVA